MTSLSHTTMSSAFNIVLCLPSGSHLRPGSSWGSWCHSEVLCYHHHFCPSRLLVMVPWTYLIGYQPWLCWFRCTVFHSSLSSCVWHGLETNFCFHLFSNRNQKPRPTDNMHATHRCTLFSLNLWTFWKIEANFKHVGIKSHWTAR